MFTFITFQYVHKNGNGNNCQPLYREYMKGEEGVWGAQPPRSQRNEKKSNKMEASPFSIIRFFFRSVYFFILF